MTATATRPVLGWHFLRADGTMRCGNKPPRVGHYLRHEGRVEMCESGLHFSRRAVDALQYAPGPVVCRVRCRGIVDEEEDKAVCRERKILWRYDATDVLRAWARWCALQVIDKWDAPDVVRRYLETGDEEIRAAARVSWASWAARDAAWAARDAAWAAAWAAARDAAWAAAWAAARDAAWAAAWDAGDTGAAQNARLETMLEDSK